MKHYSASFNQSWIKTLAFIDQAGHIVDVRGTRSTEVMGDTAVFDMGLPILTVPTRKLSYDFMFAEAGWILSGKNRVEPLVTYAPGYRKFSDDGYRLSGAYGPKIVDQITYVVDCLKNDPYSRQAVINIWRENPRTSKDIPCTISVQFMIRDNRIHTFVTMRSNDTWLGMPYDVFTFTMLTVLVGLELNHLTNSDFELGQMHHTAASRHIYFKDSEKVREVLRINQLSPTPNPHEVVSLKQLTQLFPSSLEFESMLLSRSTRDTSYFTQRPLIKKFAPWIYYGFPIITTADAGKKL